MSIKAFNLAAKPERGTLGGYGRGRSNRREASILKRCGAPASSASHDQRGGSAAKAFSGRGIRPGNSKTLITVRILWHLAGSACTFVAPAVGGLGSFTRRAALLVALSSLLAPHLYYATIKRTRSSAFRQQVNLGRCQRPEALKMGIRRDQVWYLLNVSFNNILWEYKLIAPQHLAKNGVR
jgi:hypothetical protein